MMDTWFDKMGYTMDRVLEACTKTAGISSPNFNYVNKVLENWMNEAESKGVDVNTKVVVTQAVLNQYYDYLREKAEKEAERRKNEIYEKLPRIREIDDEIRRLSAQLSRVLLSGTGEKEGRKINAMMDELTAERAIVLTENNFEMDYTDIKYACEKCDDTGITDLGERCSCIKRTEEAEIWVKKNTKKIINRITSGAASLVDRYDRGQQKLDKMRLIAHYRFAKKIHEDRKKFIEKRKSIMPHFAGFVLVAVGVVAIFNYATGFQYSYNGKALGYVKNQEDVVKLLDMVSAELSEEYGSKIKIDAEKNITFKNVVILDKDVDDIDTVLKRLTYMSDMEAEGYGIYIDDQYFVACESEKTALHTLKSIQKKYMKEDKRTSYLESGFKEKK